ncbi:MAG: NUDIX hydrolase [Candidatus Competibacteraceae bacterium]
MQQVVKATVGAIITRQEDGIEKLLLTRRAIDPFRDHFCFPGGHIDRFETAKDAIIREVKEEVGLDFVPRFFKYFDEIIPELDWHAVVLVFTGTATGTLQSQVAEVSEIGWFSLTEALAQPLAFRHREIIVAYADLHSVP